jgi:hypothetical protein
MHRFPGGRSKALNIAPAISAQPATNTNVTLNTAFSPSVTISAATLPFVVEWYKSGSSTILYTAAVNTLPYTSTPTISANAGTGDIGTYYAKLTNRASTGVTSNTTTLGILPTAPVGVTLAGNGTANTLILSFGTGTGTTYLNGGTLVNYVYTICSDAACTTPVVTSPVGTLTNVATTLQSKTATITNAALVNGTNYYAKVVVVTTSSGTSPAGLSGAAYPYAAPSAPSVTMAGNGTSNTLLVTITTPTAANLNYSTFSSFQYSLYSDSSLTNVVGSFSNITTTATSFTLTNAAISNGATYYLRVRTYSSDAGYGAWTAVTGVPTAVPSAPTSVTLTRTSSQTLTSNFSAASAQGSAVTGYQFTLYTDAALTLPVAAYTNISQTIPGNYVLYPLTNGTTYYFKVWATSALGNGAYATASAVPYDVPSAPTSVVLGSAGNGVLTLTFGASTAQGTAITGYNYTLYTDAAFTTAVVGKTDVIGATSGTVITGLTNGTTYYAKVYATSAGGNSASGNFSTGATPFTVPTAPTGVGLNTPVNGGLTLTFGASTAQGAAITGYKYTLHTNSALTAPVTGKTDITVSAGSTTITGLTNGTTYYASVYATTATAGNSPAGTYTTGLMVGAAASAPTSVTLTPTSSTSMTLGFVNSVTNGATINYYSLTLRVNTALTGAVVSGANGVTVTNGQSLVGLVAGTTYVADLVANYTFGTTGSSAVGSSPAVVCAVAPAAPTSVTLTATGQTTASLTFTGGATNGATINNYAYTMRTGSFTGFLYQSSITQASSPASITGLNTNNTYYAAVATNYTVNGVSGTTAYTNASGAATTTGGLPLAPTAALVATSGTTMTLAITPGALNGGTNTATPYTYTIKNSLGTTVQTAVSTASTSVALTGLTTGTSYYAEVTTTTNVGTSTVGTSATVLCVAAPSAPTGVTLTAASATSVTLSFTQGSSNGATLGATPNHYTLYVSTVGGTIQSQGDIAGTSVTISSLTTGTAYIASVYTASTNLGNSASANSSTITLTAPAPSAPTSVTLSRVSGSSTSLSLSFTPGATNGSTLTASPYNYTLYSGAVGSAVTASGSTTASPVTLGALVAGTTYTARMYTSSTLSGNSANADFTAGTLCAAIPTASGSITSTAGISGQITFNWAGVTFATNGSALLASPYTYTVYAQGTGAVPGAAGNTSATSIVQTGLNNGTAYYIIVTAANSVGSSAAVQSSTVTCYVPAPTVAPTIASITYLTTKSSRVNFSGTAPAGATSITAFDCPSNTTYWLGQNTDNFTGATNPSIASNCIEVNALLAATFSSNGSVTCKFAYTNAAGTGTWSVPMRIYYADNGGTQYTATVAQFENAGLPVTTGINC